MSKEILHGFTCEFVHGGDTCKLVDVLVHENNRLREQADFEHFQLGEMKKAAGMMLNEFVALENRNARLATENAKLRELCEKYFGYYVSGTLTPCDFCDRYDCEGTVPTTCKADEYDPDGMVVEEIERRMRELGIEVG